MTSFKIKNVELGAGIPKICVPIVGKTREEILTEGEQIKLLPADIVEWRVDFFEAVLDFNQVKEILIELNKILEDLPILFTFRTQKEGGERELDSLEYKGLYLAVARSGLVDLIDVEGFLEEALVEEIITTAHSCGVKVIVSNHDFTKTPSKEEIIYRLLKMQGLKGDALKLAVMPKNPKDVLTLIEATEEMNRLYGDRPIIAVAMSGLGLITRLSGEVFGSAMTFASGSHSSAPGQIPAEELKEILQLMHKYK